MYHRRCLTDAVVLDRHREFAACLVEDQANAKLSGEIARLGAGRFGRRGVIEFRKFVEWRKAEVPLDGLPRTDRIGRCRLVQQLALPRQLYQSLNHVLYNPVLPLELYVGSTTAPIYGNGYRLSSLGASKATTAPALDKVFPPQPVGV